MTDKIEIPEDVKCPDWVPIVTVENWAYYTRDLPFSWDTDEYFYNLVDGAQIELLNKDERYQEAIRDREIWAYNEVFRRMGYTEEF